jgi:hypothetical protein
MSMLRYFKRVPVETVMGHRLPEPRPTLMAVFWGMVYLGIPVLSIGVLLDGLIQMTTGQCTGMWCWFN